MSEENKKMGEGAGNAAQNVFETIKSNPKVLYGLLGIVAVGSLAMALLGGGSGQVQVRTAVTSGQTVSLENPNGGNSHITSGPGLINASDGEEDKDSSVCVAVAGTHATVEEEQVVGQLPFVKVKVSDGECQGKIGWTSKINVKSGQ